MRVRGATVRALWNLRALGLVLLGPVLGVAVGAAVFGMPAPLIRAAAAMLLFSLAVLAVLVRGERQRLVSPRRPPAA